MKQTTALAIALLLAGCAAARPEATLTFSGSEPRVETWTPVVVERGHLHADLALYPCPRSGVLQITDSMKSVAGPRAATSSDQMGLLLGGMMDRNCAQQYGPAYGGPEHLVLGLIRLGASSEEGAGKAGEGLGSGPPARPLPLRLRDLPDPCPRGRRRAFHAGGVPRRGRGGAPISLVSPALAYYSSP